MIGSGKPLLGLWLYRSGNQWSVKHDLPLPASYKPVQNAGIKPDTSSSIELNDTNETAVRSLIFTLNNQIGGLAKCLRVFQELKINVLHIESRKKLNEPQQVNIFSDRKFCSRQYLILYQHFSGRYISGCRM